MILTQKIRTLRPVEDQIERDQLKTSAKSRSGAIAVGLASVGFRLTELVLEIGLTNSNVEPLGGNNGPCSSCRPEQSVFVPSPSGRIGITCTWHQKHRPRWRHRLQVPLRLQLEDGRKSNDMDQGKNPVEEGWKFLQNAKKLTSRTLTSHTKGNNRTPTWWSFGFTLRPSWVSFFKSKLDSHRRLPAAQQSKDKKQQGSGQLSE